MRMRMYCLTPANLCGQTPDSARHTQQLGFHGHMNTCAQVHAGGVSLLYAVRSQTSCVIEVTFPVSN